MESVIYFLQTFELRLFALIAISFLITYVSIPVIIKVAKMKHLYDEPEDRSSHSSSTPTLGGVAIFASVLISISLFADEKYVDFALLNAAMVILFFFGIKDDILMISPIKKLFAQVLSALMISIGSNVRIPQLFDIFGFTEIPYWFSIAITVFVIIVIINAYNLIDGVDGLAASSAIFSSTIFGIWFYINHYHSMSLVSFALVGSLVAFLRFNFSKSNKIFMGDTGSMLVGFMVAIQAIEFMYFNSMEIQGGSTGWSTAPVIAISILMIPLLDTIRVFTIRILNKKSPFEADRNHIHHRLEDLGFSHVMIVIVMISSNLLIVLLALHMKDTGIDKFLLLMISVASFFSSIPYLVRTKKQKDKVSNSATPIFKLSRKKKGSDDNSDKKKING